MLKKIRNKILLIRIAIAHAAYHRAMRKAESARVQQNIVKFKKYIYRAETAWKRVILLTYKLRLLHGKKISV
jgi:hypothetical protein